MQCVEKGQPSVISQDGYQSTEQQNLLQSETNYVEPTPVQVLA